jgi:hypothetical protein
MDDDSCTWTQGRYKILQDLDTVLVCPVVEDRAKVVHVCNNWLRVEKVTRY